MRATDDTALSGMDELKVRWISRFMAGVLSLSALLKFGGFLGSPYELDFGPYPIGLKLFAATLELLLAGWFFLGRRTWFQWSVAILVLCIFVLASANSALAGHISCGCFGAQSIHPWMMFFGDVVALSLLWIFRPIQVPSNAAFVLSNFALGFAISCGFVCLTLGHFFKDPKALAIATARLHGEDIVVLPRVIRLPAAKRGDFVDVQVEIVSLSEVERKVNGAVSYFGDDLISGLPARIPPNCKITLPLKTHNVGPVGKWQRYICFTTDNTLNSAVFVRLSGEVLRSRSQEYSK